MIPIEQLEIGMQIKIVDKWCGGCYENPKGLMDHWLGKVVTVREVFDRYVTIEEDTSEYTGDGWCWFPPAIDYIVDYMDVDFDEAEFFTMLEG